MSSLRAQQDSECSQFSLMDGTEVTIRSLRAEDSEALGLFVAKLSEDTVYFRFLTSGIDKGVLAKELSPRIGSVALVAESAGRILGHASYFSYDSEAAEVGILILDGFQGKGLGTCMIESIAKAANAAGVSMFETIIGWNNTRMIRMVRSLGFPTSERVEQDVIRIRFPTSIDPVSIAEFQEKWVFQKPDV